MVWKKIYGDILDLYNMMLMKYQQLYKEFIKVILGMDVDSCLVLKVFINLWEDLMML